MWISIFIVAHSFCFNPCFLGSCSPRLRMHSLSEKMTLVSILVFLDLALRVYPPRVPAHLGVVSILVFLDLALRVPLGHPRGSITTGFNPCFLGSCSPRGCRSRKQRQYAVSILVFLDLALRVLYSICHMSECVRFQSLFSWILLSELRSG